MPDLSTCGELADRATVTCRYCRRTSARNASMIPVPVPGMRFEYECRDYQNCIDYSHPGETERVIVLGPVN